MSLAQRLLAGDIRALAQALSLIENESPEAAGLMRQIYQQAGHALFVGVTGPPGAGKSTLVDRLVTEFRARQLKVGVLAVDPSSPFSGGAILGDRVRMQAHAEDAGVFIRSMATRGQLGGLARTTGEAATVLDAAGFDVVIIETVGVGQAEVDVVRTADLSLVVVAPGAGDDVQALKAGIMEIADIFVVNKADREGADRTVAAIEGMLSLQSWPAGSRRPPVLQTIATIGRGVPELMDTIEHFNGRAAPTPTARRHARAESHLREILNRGFQQQVEERLVSTGEFARLVDALAERSVDPHTAAARARQLLAEGQTGALDHVGIAVEDATAMAARFRDLFGLQTDAPEDVAGHRVRFVDTGPARLELVEPLSQESAVAKFLSARGSGLHHLCLRVPDLDAALAALKARGVRLVDEAARSGAHGARIAFVHPSSTAGILIELKEG
jgi:LAO/AO transport system kinase